ncbi:MAG: holo-ACP synthase [Bacillota bacterium]|uniref:Holo-[acyl-carrier-protein] synthase n=1 Tax=[Clostridium] aminophilum TaxID=1526 RepID=A0A1I6K3T3_9FIRM|nr:holo-ACP synthase [[Clostridium] aminophilum]MCR4628224.1 holo-ACP synthase [Clostridium sp.]MDT3843595.1 holo-ACP synthase [Bacillota bacterium]SFR85824.1 holo-[acyl-carrier protein] synthase [[Clostridium] aminophilum]
MIAGIGIDTTEIERMEHACRRETFVSHVFTENERRQAGGSSSRLAGDFAVKEAVSKALGTGFRNFGPTDIEALRDELGAPYCVLYGKAKERADSLGIVRIHVSITNTKTEATAFAVAERQDQP